MSEDKAQITGMNYVLAVPDAMTTARWWIDEMKFEKLRDLGGWVFVKRGPCMIMLGSCPDAIPVADLGDHQYFGYIEFDDIDAYFDEIKDGKVDLLSTPEDKPWDMREFGVRTPDGHRVMFGENL